MCQNDQFYTHMVVVPVSHLCVEDKLLSRTRSGTQQVHESLRGADKAVTMRGRRLLPSSTHLLYDAEEGCWVEEGPQPVSGCLGQPTCQHTVKEGAPEDEVLQPLLEGPGGGRG